MQNRVLSIKNKSPNISEENTIIPKKVDVNILLNRVKSEKR